MNYSYTDCLAIFGVGGAHPGGLQLTKELLSREKINETTSILDAGCGTGQTSAYIAEQYRCKVTSLDSNKIMLDKARKRFLPLRLPIEVKQGSTENLPFSEGIFDLILSESVISFTDVSLTIPEFRRVLKPNGVLLAIEMVLEKSLSEEELKTLVNFYGVSQILTEKEWSNFFQRSKFKHVNIEKYNLQIDENNVQNATDFSLSENIDDEFFEILEKHMHFTKVYKDVLGFRLFRCYK
ncbi:methyltransferase domain-containing protein [Neobacillus sp. WH10]|uniref:class I SAM-dependent methyltransferase n=1 Tax=Neobacillus sp. WH10 TaxID=3047873 RepID=UPI0024C14556|nr:class I SAM-dependent methyltransferase [Neobacillus sp. WH10]WHY75130.1 methyltransferase domain-containing protein [Neobacillus sp. WH10]